MKSVGERVDTLASTLINRNATVLEVVNAIYRTGRLTVAQVRSSSIKLNVPTCAQHLSIDRDEDGPFIWIDQLGHDVTEEQFRELAMLAV